MFCSLSDFGKAYQVQLRRTFDGQRSDHLLPDHFQVNKHWQTWLGDTLISLGEKVKGECASPELSHSNT